MESNYIRDKIQKKNSSIIKSGRDRYFSKEYLHVNRWTTYAKLIKTVLEINPSNIVEIGIGNGLVSDILQKIGYSVEVIDNDETLKPDYICDIRNIDKLEFKNQVDLVIASQVMEHIEYTEFIKVIKGLNKITKYVILTLPYTNENAHLFSLNLKFIYKLKFVKKLFFKRISKPPKKSHYWEIGIKNYPLRKVKRDIKNNGWRIFNSFLNEENPYHYFFIIIAKH